jgi:HlyD family secretion protein
MQIDCNVVEADIGRILMSLPVEFTVDAYPDLVFKGTVSEIRNAPVIVQNVVTYDVVVRVGNPELRLKPGMTANVSMIISSKKEALRAPNAALRFTLPEAKKTAPRENSTGVWILENEKPKRIQIVTGISDGNFTEVVSGNIKEGEEVIVESLSKPKKSSSSGPRMF